MASMTWRRFVTLVAGLSGDSRLAAVSASAKKKPTERETPAQTFAAIRAMTGAT